MMGLQSLAELDEGQVKVLQGTIHVKAQAEKATLLPVPDFYPKSVNFLPVLLF